MNKAFEKRVVLFIDILGFSEKIKKCQNDLSQITKIYDTLSIMKDHFIKHEDLLRVHFSDSIVISFKAEEEAAILELIGSIQSLIKKIVNQGFLIRGGIAYGDVFHDIDFIFGPAMNVAYALESKKAIVPRIIIQSEIIEKSKLHLPIFFNEGMENYVFNYISTDNDGSYYVDYFKKGIDTFWEANDFDKQFVINLKSIIEEGLREEDMLINIKFQWMKSKYNDLITELKECSQITCGGITIGSDKSELFYEKLSYIE